MDWLGHMNPRRLEVCIASLNIRSYGSLRSYVRTGVVTAFWDIRRWWRRPHVIPALDFHIGLVSSLLDRCFPLLDKAKVIIFDLSR